MSGHRSPIPAAWMSIIVRENVEGEYCEAGGRIYAGRPEECAIQEAVFTRTGIERVARFAAELAAERSGLVVSATKSNGIIHSMPFWDEVVSEVIAGYGDVRIEHVLIDALAARAVLKPGSLDVIVASNLFGDIFVRPDRRPSRVHRSRAEREPQPRPGIIRQCSSQCTGPHRTSPARASPIPSARSGRAR